MIIPLNIIVGAGCILVCFELIQNVALVIISVQPRGFAGFHLVQFFFIV